MYERHFGITGPPFQLSPDPHFYFDSDQHRAARMALRQASSRGLPFIVLSGEIGSGKTTVLREWLADTEASGVAVAQLANTQLDAGELMAAIATAFGVAAEAPNDASEAPLQAFMRSLQGRAALLIVDEAQNLDQDGMHQLVALADMAASEGVALRICLAGQPELRARIADPGLLALQSRVQQSFHLGPLAPAQTRQYIEHRLLKVGWTGTPSFDAAAFNEIHHLTGGIPRRINVLSNRLMLAQFLSCGTRIDARNVIATAHALHAEFGDEPPFHVAGPGAPGALTLASIGQGAFLVVASGRSDHIKAVPLLRAMSERHELSSATLVSVWDDGAWPLNQDLHAFAGLGWQRVVLVDAADAALEDIEARFHSLVEQCRPRGVIVFDGDPASHSCATIARYHQVPLVHVGTDAQGTEEMEGGRSERAAISRLADLRFDCRPVPSGPHSGTPRSFGAGNVLVDAVYLALQMNVQRSDRSEPVAAGEEPVDDRRGYGVVALKQRPASERSPCRPDLVPILRELSRDLPLVWPMRQATMLSMQASGLARRLAGDRIACIEELGHAGFIRLLSGATCVVTDCLDVAEEAAVLGVPLLSVGDRHAASIHAGGWMGGFEVGSSVTGATRAVWHIMFNGDDLRAPPVTWDGHAGARIAAHLARWVASRESATEQVLDAVQPPG